jgi:archaellum component FlaC
VLHAVSGVPHHPSSGTPPRGSPNKFAQSQDKYGFQSVTGRDALSSRDDKHFARVYFYFVPLGHNGLITGGAGLMVSVSVSDGGADLAAELEAARRVIEDHFVATGEFLTQSIEGIDALIASLEKLVVALDPKAVASTTEDIRTAAGTLLALSDNHRERQKTIEALGKHREGLAKSVQDMRASLAYMRAFTVNIKIVSSGIAEAGGAFESFAQEISDCIESGREELRKVEEEIAALQSELSAALSEGTMLSSRMGTELPALHKQLSESAVMMGEHYGRVSSVAGDVTGIARDIQKRVVRVLQALQVGDITRQRIEHVQAGITHLRAGEPDERLAAMGYSLMAAQLVATIDDFHREVAEIERAMADMASHSRELLKLRDMAYGGSGEGFLNDLGGRIEQALVLVNEIEGADTSALKTGRETAAAAGHLGERISAIQSLKNDVQYMALNTTIKCAQIGEAARPLSVIAIELRDHGRHLESAAADGLSSLDELTSAAGVLTAAGDGEEHLSATQALDIASNLIRDARIRTETEVAGLVSNGEALLNVLDKSTSRLAFRAEIGNTLESVASELTVLGSAAPHEADGIEEAVTAMLEQFHRQYTMAQERDVHEAFTSSARLDHVEGPARRAVA